MKYLLSIIFLLMISCDAPNKKDQVTNSPHKAESIHNLQYLFALPEKAEFIVILKEYNSFGEYREAIVEKFCNKMDYEVYLQIDIEDSKLQVPFIRPYCGEAFELLDRNIIKVYTLEDITSYEKHLLNYGNNKKLSVSPEKAVVLIYLTDSSSIDSLRTINL